MIVSMAFPDAAMQQAVGPTQLAVDSTNGCISMYLITVSSIASGIASEIG